MPESFQDQMDRTHNTRPMMNQRRINIENLVNGVGVIVGFHIDLTSPISKKIQVSRGILAGPDGEQVRVALDPTLAGAEYQKALSANRTEFDASAVIDASGGLDPSTHALLITVVAGRDIVKAHKITLAEQTAIETALGSEFDVDKEAIAEFDAATGDHVARARGTFFDAEVGDTGTFASEYIIGTAAVDATGGDIDTVVNVKEKKVQFQKMAL